MDMFIDLFEKNNEYDWNWTLGYWAYDILESNSRFREHRDMAPMCYMFDILFVFTDLSFDKLLKIIFWIVPGTSLERSVNYHRAKLALARSEPFWIKLVQDLGSIARYLAIFIQYHLWLIVLAIWFTPVRQDRVFGRIVVPVFQKPFQLMTDSEVETMVYIFIATIFILAQLTFKLPRKLRLAGDIIRHIEPQIRRDPGSVWRFKQRDAYDILFRHLNVYVWIDRSRNHYAYQAIHNHVLYRKPETRAEKKRLADYQTKHRIGRIRRLINWIDRAWAQWSVWQSY